MATVRPLGAILLAAAGIYFAATARRKKELALKQWHFSLPSWRLAAGQTIISAADWLMAGAVLYSLLPKTASLGFSHFLEIYLLAQLVGLISQVPGGLGVFESVILLLAPAGMTAPQLLGPLIVYRGIYYLFPLLLATIVLGIGELLNRKVFFRQGAVPGRAAP